jgi:signal transduction histidine kinase
VTDRSWWQRARGSVRVRLTLLAAGAFAITLVVASVLLLRALERNLVDDIRDADRDALAFQAVTLTEDGIPADAQIISRADGSQVATWDSGGQRFAIVAQAGEPEVSPDTQAGESGEPEASPDRSSDLTSAVDALAPPPNRGDFILQTLPVGESTLATLSTLDEVQATIDTTRRLLWIVGPALVALVAGLAWLLAGRALKPVRAMTSRVSAIESRSLHERVPEPPSGDEVAELARTMNQMLGRLERATETSHRLLSDASHELRTPVAVMRTELEVAQRDRANDWSATGDVLLGELDRLLLLVDDLLLLARGDELSYERTEVDLDAVVDKVTSRRRRVPVDRVANSRESRATSGADVHRDRQQRPTTVVGDERALGRAFDHLVANAARAANERVAVTIERNGGEQVAVHVDDDGPGIPADQRAAVVRRFVRLDEGRARDEGGSGLGLAVASDVATAHGGRLRITDSPLGGARVTIVLPVPTVAHHDEGPPADDPQHGPKVPAPLTPRVAPSPDRRTPEAGDPAATNESE